MENLNPRVFEKATNRPLLPEEEDDTVRDEVDSREIFGKCCRIKGGKYSDSNLWVSLAF